MVVLESSGHLDVLSALQQPLVKIPGVSELLLLDLKVNVGLPQHLRTPQAEEQQLVNVQIKACVDAWPCWSEIQSGSRDKKK